MQQLGEQLAELGELAAKEIIKTAVDKLVDKLTKDDNEHIQELDSEYQSTHYPESAISYEEYKIELRRDMGKPHVEDPKLWIIVENLYRPGAKIGSGSTAAAMRNELLTGESTSGKFHDIKVKDYLRGLKNWLKNNPTARAGDRAAAENIIADLEDALNTKLSN